MPRNQHTANEVKKKKTTLNFGNSRKKRGKKKTECRTRTCRFVNKTSVHPIYNNRTTLFGVYDEANLIERER